MSGAFELEIVVAVDEAGGIGKDGGIPWRLPGDMAHFKRLTQAAAEGKRNAVIMGRATWDSIPERFRPLSERLNVVLSRREDLTLGVGVLQARSFEEALERIAERREDTDHVFVIGGGNVYAQALARDDCKVIHLTRVGDTFGCDTFFAGFAESFEREEISVDGAEEGGVPYRIERWIRNGS
jgi:dihydrofolate reductase